MKYLKLFEAFTNQNYREIIKGSGNLSTRRSKGSANWFTEGEIDSIRNKGKELGISYIADKNRGGVKSFFGDSSGKGGLRESVANFFRGGSLCNQVNLSSSSGTYNVIKKEGDFILNGKNTGKSMPSMLNMLR
jgi:hypothetical protein